ncbi:hypothetical protein ScalyP_jg3730 [Parmales sp. scaly parma]|nr:hypothetical protein ScalyP_jg3730 [Parmales sp. scaly parma]
MGNTCYISCVLQCLLSCVSLQNYFLRDCAHDFRSCTSSEEGEEKEKVNKLKRLYSSTVAGDPTSPTASSRQNCLACELDKIFLSTFGRTIGLPVLRTITNIGQIPPECSDDTDSEEAWNNNNKTDVDSPLRKIGHADSSTEGGELVLGLPIVPSSLLHSVSTNPLTKHLSGHKQHDAHEFLVAFLNAIIEVEEKEKGNRAQSEVEKLFQGKMQSKLTCGYCSHSSSVSETFINISLPMSTMSGMNMYTSESKSNTPQGTPSSTPSPSPTPEVMLAGGGGAAKERPSNVTLESLLQKFTSLESLTDSTSRGSTE